MKASRLPVELFLAVCLCLVLASTVVRASVEGLSPEVESHIFMTEVDGGNYPVVNANSRKVQVRKPDGELVWLDGRDYQAVRKKIPCVGRIVLYGSQGTSRQEVYGDYYMADVENSTQFTFNIQADRDLEDVYVVIFGRIANQDQVSVSFGSIGDLKGGERTTRDVRFPSFIGNGIQFTYWFEFFSRGRAVELLPFPNILANPRSKNLNIPFQTRLDTYLELAERENMTARPRPFTMGLAEFPLEACRSRGVDEFKIILVVRKDGTLKLDDPDPQLTSNEIAALRKEIQYWEFFPSVKDGEPVDDRVSLPIRL